MWSPKPRPAIPSRAPATLVKTVSRAASGTAMAAPFTAPATRFNAEVTSERTIALAQLDLDDVKRVELGELLRRC